MRKRSIYHQQRYLPTVYAGELLVVACPRFGTRKIAVDSRLWHIWLWYAQRRLLPFRFATDQGVIFTARIRESVWIAHRQIDGRNVSCCLGTRQTLTLERLESAAARIQAQCDGVPLVI